MNNVPTCGEAQGAISRMARDRLGALRWEPFLMADWDRVLMLHFEVDPVSLQRTTSYELDLWEGRAFVTLVAFTMRGMRLRVGGNFSRWLLHPLATHEFLNVRTYVKCGEERGIHFLAEWLPNRLAVWLGPRTFGLPYRHGRLRYQHEHESRSLRGEVIDTASGGRFAYTAKLANDAFAQCPTGSLTEWLMERYSAFNCTCGHKRFFRVWHRPWEAVEAEVELLATDLLEQRWPWFRGARYLGANYSSGVRDVWMSRPYGVQTLLPQPGESMAGVTSPAS